FWYGAVPLAAGFATLKELLEGDALPNMRRAGARLRKGLATQADSYGYVIRQTGPVQMPVLYFDGDDDLSLVTMWLEAALNHGVFLHPWHNWFLSAAHTDEDIDAILECTDAAFADLKRGSKLSRMNKVENRDGKF